MEGKINKQKQRIERKKQLLLNLYVILDKMDRRITL